MNITLMGLPTMPCAVGLAWMRYRTLPVSKRRPRVMVLMEGERLRQRIAGQARAGCRVTVTGVLPYPRLIAAMT